MINKHNNISSQDALFNNVSIRDTLKSESIEANQIIKSANPGSTGRVILNGTLTVLGNDNSIDTIKNVNITNNELEFTNELGTTTANKITQENGTTNITGGNITFNHTLEVTGDNNNVTTISDANITNNKEIEFINENGNTTADNITGESTITNGNISFNHVVTVKNQQDNQNNITSIIDSNITNNNQMKFTNQTANSLIDNITGESTITSGNISFDNIVTVKNQQENKNNITSITDSNITNNNSMSFTNQTANTTIDTLQDGEGNLTITGGNITSNNVVTVKNEQNNNNNITSITNSTITNDNEIKLTNPIANTIIDTLQDGEGNLTITGGNITSNNVVTVKNEQNDNNNITSITDSNLTNNNTLTFTKQTANTAIDTLQAGGGELTITGGNISFDNVVTINNEQDNQNNITSITDSNINNNNSMSFTNETANTTIDTLQKGEGDLTITGGNINTNNIITVTDQSVITSLTNANITNSGTFTLNNASIDQLITSTINGSKTENDSLKETKFKYKEETLKKSTDTVTGTKYYNIPYVKVLNNVTYYGDLFNKTEELNTSYVDYDMKYYYADIIYYQYQNKIVIPEDQNVTVNKADQISLVNADVTNNGTLNISDGSVIQEIIGDVKFSGKVNLEAVTEIRDVDNIILEEAIITNNKGITITNESTISSIRNSNIGGDVTIDTKGHVSVDNVVNSTITNGTVTINDNITSTVINSNLVGGTVNFGENKTLTVDVKAGTLENEIIKTITDSTINNVNVTLNNNITSTVTNSDLNATTIDLNNNTLTTKEGVTSSFDNINNSTITNGDVLVNNNLDSLITNSTLKDNVTIDLNTNSLNAKSGSSVNEINNSTITNGDITINNGLNPVLANVVLGDNVNNNVNVDLNSHLLTANSGSSVSNINKSTITNGDITVNNSLESLLTDVVLGDNENNNVNIDLNTKSLNAKTDSSVSNINNSTITNGNVSISNNLTSSITDVTLSNITDVNLNDNSLTANNGSTVSNINNSTITNGNISISNDLTSSLANVTLNNIGNIDLNTHSLNAKTDTTVSKIDNSTITNGNVTVNNNLDSLLTNASLSNIASVDLNTKSLNAKSGSSVDNINNSTLTNGNVTVNNNLESLLTNVSLNDNVNVYLNTKSLNAKSGSTVSNINNSTITDGNVLVNNNLTSTLTDVTLKDNVTVDLNNTYSLTTKTGTNSTVSNIDNSTITNGNVSVNNDLNSVLANVTLSNITEVDLNSNLLTANNGSSVSNINNSTITNGSVSVSNDLTSSLADVTLNNIGNVNLNDNSLTANNGSSVSNINNSTITNGDITVSNNLDSLLTNVVLGDNVNNDVKVNLNDNSLTAKTGSSISDIKKSTITNGDITVNDNLSSLLTGVVLGDNVNNNVNVNLNTKSLNATAGSSISNINNSTITNGTVAINENLSSLLTDVTLSDNVNVDLNSNTLTANNDSTVSNINNSTITKGNVSVNNNLTSSLANVTLKDNVTVDLNNTYSLTANNGSSVSNINNSTITDGNVLVNNNLTSVLTNATLNNIANVDLNTHSLTTKTGTNSTVSNINNSTITDGNIAINNDLNTVLTNVVLGDNANVNLSGNSLNAKSGSSISNIKNSTLTNGTLTINNDITSQVTNSSIENGTVDLNNHKLTANGDITLINITGGVITNTGTLEANGTITANQINSNLLKDQTGTNQIMAYDKDNKKITFCNHTTLTCSGTEDTLTTDNLVIDRITLNEVREVDGGIITTGLKIGFPYWVDLGTTEQGSTINIQGNILHVIKVLDGGVNHYHLWISMMDIEFSLKSEDTKIISKGSKFVGSELIKSLDDLTLKENEHLYIQTKDVNNIANGKPLNDMVINATIDNNGVITGKSLQTNQILNEAGNKSIINYDPVGTGTKPKITLGAEGVDLEIVGFDQKNIVCETLTAQKKIYTNNIYSYETETEPQSLFIYDSSSNTITIGDSSISSSTTTSNLTVTNNLMAHDFYSNKFIYADNIYSRINTGNPIVRYDKTSGNTPGVMLGNVNGKNTIYNSIVLGLYPHNNPTFQIFGELQDSNVATSDYSVIPSRNYIFFGNSGFAYTLIHKLRTNDSLYAPSIYYWPENTAKSSAIPLLVYNNSTITLGNATTNISIPGTITSLKTNSITDSEGHSIISVDTGTDTITLGNSSTKQETHNLTVTSSLIASTDFYSNKMTSINNVPLLNYVPSNNTITLGNATTKISIPGTLITDSIKDSESQSIISVDTKQDIITIGNDYKQTKIKNADYSDIFNKIYVSIGQNIKFKIYPKIAIDKAIKTVNIASVTVTKDGTTTTKANVTAYQNADNIYNNYTTGQIFLDRLSTSTDTTTEVDVYIIPKKRNFFDHETNTGAFYTKQTARMCFVFCNLYFIIKSPSGDETSSGLWTSSNGNVWYEFNPKDFNNKTGPYSDTAVTGAKFDISLTTQITNLSIGYIPRGWMTGYEEYEDHYVLGFPLITVSNEAYYAAFLLYDYDEYMTREVTYDGGCTIL